MIVIGHGPVYFIAPLSEQSFRRDVSRNIIRIRINPNFFFNELALYPKTIIHNNLATQEHHSQLISNSILESGKSWCWKSNHLLPVLTGCFWRKGPEQPQALTARQVLLRRAHG